jgi:hypothetical protein
MGNWRKKEALRPADDDSVTSGEAGDGQDSLRAHGLGGLHRAVFWRSLGFPNLVHTRAAKANKRRLRLLEEWKRRELQRTPFAIPDEAPDELTLPRSPKNPMSN